MQVKHPFIDLSMLKIIRAAFRFIFRILFFSHELLLTNEENNDRGSNDSNKKKN